MKIFLKGLVILNAVAFWAILNHLFSSPDSTGPAWVYLYVMGCVFNAVAARSIWHMVEMGIKDQL